MLVGLFALFAVTMSFQVYIPVANARCISGCVGTVYLKLYDNPTNGGTVNGISNGGEIAEYCTTETWVSFSITANNNAGFAFTGWSNGATSGSITVNEPCYPGETVTYSITADYVQTLFVRNSGAVYNTGGSGTVGVALSNTGSLSLQLTSITNLATSGGSYLSVQNANVPPEPFTISANGGTATFFLDLSVSSNAPLGGYNITGTMSFNNGWSISFVILVLVSMKNGYQFLHYYVISSTGQITSQAFYSKVLSSSKLVVPSGFTNSSTKSGNYTLREMKGYWNSTFTQLLIYNESGSNYNFTLTDSIIENMTTLQNASLVWVLFTPKTNDVNLGDAFLVNYSSAWSNEINAIETALGTEGSAYEQSSNSSIQTLASYYSQMAGGLGRMENAVAGFLGNQFGQRVINGTVAYALDVNAIVTGGGSLTSCPPSGSGSSSSGGIGEGCALGAVSTLGSYYGMLIALAFCGPTFGVGCAVAVGIGIFGIVTGLIGMDYACPRHE